jgi:mono/diheme cytochrome c family protein
MGKGFGLGVLVTLIALCAAAYIYFERGFVDIRADSGPGAFDNWLGAAMDASAARHAPRVNSPIPSSEANLVAGAKLYVDKCAECHGTPVNTDSELGKAFQPVAPQFFGEEPPDMPANQNFFIIKHGIRMTAMPGWGSIMRDNEIWQVVDMLAKIRNLPPSVQQELRKPAAAPVL